jgi:hypothetical protein
VKLVEFEHASYAMTIYINPEHVSEVEPSNVAGVTKIRLISGTLKEVKQDHRQVIMRLADSVSPL